MTHRDGEVLREVEGIDDAKDLIEVTAGGGRVENGEGDLAGWVDHEHLCMYTTARRRGD